MKGLLSSRVWSLDEIHSCPEFGGGVGWFYGLMKHNGKLRVIEILPGYGYTVEWPWRPRAFWWALKDIRNASAFKEKYVGKGDPNNRRADGDEFISLDELIDEVENGTTPWSEIKHKKG
jgi:hypothetical protein